MPVEPAKNRDELIDQGGVGERMDDASGFRVGRPKNKQGRRPEPAEEKPTDDAPSKE